MTFRLLHLADLHLDRSFAGLGCHGDLARRRRHGLREALRRAGDTALRHGCAAVTIGGDLYEQERAGVDTERFLVETFASWRPMRVFIAPGNHDSLLPGSLYRRAEWPDNVHVFNAPVLEPVQLADGLTLWGLGHREPAWQGDPLAGEPVQAGGGVHLALFHGAELGSRPDGKSIHGPFHAADVRRRGFSAALCGHYHRRRIDSVGALVYPGSPEPLTFDETGGRGPVLVEVDGSDVRYEPVDDNRWAMVVADCDAGGCGSSAAVLERVEAAVAGALAGADPERALVRVDLVGDLDPGAALDAYSMESALQERNLAALIRVRDLTAVAFDAAAIAAERTTQGTFVRAVQAAAAAAETDDERAELDEALRYGLLALSGAEVGLR
ncbi:MAG: metallophosphoesterase [Candidatus Dormibacteraeota bacterium]|nr:metallophosphoesterase [Candidatus Dormibacteraeota bacterium]